MPTYLSSSDALREFCSRQQEKPLKYGLMDVGIGVVGSGIAIASGAALVLSQSLLMEASSSPELTVRGLMYTLDAALIGTSLGMGYLAARTMGTGIYLLGKAAGHQPREDGFAYAGSDGFTFRPVEIDRKPKNRILPVDCAGGLEEKVGKNIFVNGVVVKDVRVASEKKDDTMYVPGSVGEIYPVGGPYTQHAVTLEGELNDGPLLARTTTRNKDTVDRLVRLRDSAVYLFGTVLPNKAVLIGDVGAAFAR